MANPHKTLCLDLGNSVYKAALFVNDVMHEQFLLEKENVDSLVAVLNKVYPDFSILASVSNHPDEWERLLQSGTIFHKVSHSSRLNFNPAINKPETIGADRLALVAGAVNERPGRNVLVIALGTCITYNFVNKTGLFPGGSISPGMDMRLHSLHTQTSGLPEVRVDPASLGWAIPLIGYDTNTAIQSGVVHGIIAELEGIIEKYHSRYQELEIILSGGLSPYFAGLLKNRIFADSNLLFKGLYALSQLNCK